MTTKIIEIESDIPVGLYDIANLVCEQFSAVKSRKDNFQVSITVQELKQLTKLKAYLEENFLNILGGTFQPTKEYEEIKKAAKPLGAYSKDLRILYAVDSLYAVIPIKIFNVIKDFFLVASDVNTVLSLQNIVNRLSDFQKEFFESNERHRNISLITTKYLSLLKGILYFMVGVAFKDLNFFRDARFHLGDSLNYVEETARYLLGESILFQSPPETQLVPGETLREIADSPDGLNLIQNLGFYLNGLYLATEQILNKRPVKEVIKDVSDRSIKCFQEDTRYWFHSFIFIYLTTPNVLGILDSMQVK